MRSEPEKKIQRDSTVPAEIPGIEIEKNYEAVPDPAIEHEVEKEPIDVRKLTLTACVHACLSVVGTSLATTRGMDNDGVSDDAPVIDLTGSDPFLSGNHKKGSNKKWLMAITTVAMTRKISCHTSGTRAMVAAVAMVMTAARTKNTLGLV